MKKGSPVFKSLKKMHRLEAITGFAFIMPQMLGFIFFVLMPLIMIFVYSFQQKNLLFGTSTFTGMDNFFHLAKDSLFSKSLVNTLIFSLGSCLLI